MGIDREVFTPKDLHYDCIMWQGFLGCATNEDYCKDLCEYMCDEDFSFYDWFRKIDINREGVELIRRRGDLFEKKKIGTADHYRFTDNLLLWLINFIRDESVKDKALVKLMPEYCEKKSEYIF